MKPKNYAYPDRSLEKKGITVVQRPGESVDSMIRRFKKKYMNSGILIEYKSKMYYEKPSDKRRRKKREAINRFKKEEAIRQAKEKKEYERKNNYRGKK